MKDKDGVSPSDPLSLLVGVGVRLSRPTLGAHVGNVPSTGCRWVALTVAAGRW